MSGVGRPALRLGGHGKINVREARGGTGFTARTTWRHPATGESRDVTSTAATRGRAKAALEDKLANLNEMSVGSDGLSGTSRVRDLGDAYLEWLDGNARLATQTKARYKYVLAGPILSRIGELRLHEVTPAKLSALIEGINVDSASDARMARGIVRKLFKLAVDRGALAVSPAVGMEVSVHSTSTHTARALSIEEAATVFQLIDAHRAFISRGPRSRKAHDDIRDVMLIQLAAGGLRVSEAAAITASDVEWTTGTLTVDAAIVYEEKTSSRPGRYVRQPHTKRHDVRVVQLPRFAVDILARRAQTAGENGLLFCTGEGKPLSLNNLRRALREALKGSGFEWVSTHTMRRTIGTAVARNTSAEFAQRVLGHRDIATTRGYIEKARDVIDITSLTERYAIGE